VLEAGNFATVVLLPVLKNTANLALVDLATAIGALRPRRRFPPWFFGYALATSAPGQPDPWAALTKVRRLADQQAGHGPRLGIEGNLFSLLALQIRDLVTANPVGLY
jgi:hypothetical protein